MKKLLLFACAALLFSCGSDDDSSNNNDNTPESGVAYIKGKMDGDSFDYTFNNAANDTYLYNAMTGYSGLDSQRWYYYGGSLSRFTPTEFLPEMAIAWNNVFYSASGSTGEADAFYTTTGDLPSNFLTLAQDDDHMPGVEITFAKPDGRFYTSKEGSQSGSSISISDYTEGNTGVKTMTVVGTFSCKLYNEDDATDVINVTNGKFKLILSQFD